MSAETSIVIVDPGLLSTVQDLGRRGGGAMGISPSGAVDWFAARAANRLVGNADDAALVETTLTGVTFEAHGDLTVAVSGALARLTIGGRGCASWRSWPAREGERVVVGPALRGVRSYVALGGGIGDMPRIMASAATDVAGGFGGRVLVKGDRLRVGPADHACAAGMAYPVEMPPALGSPVTLRATIGPNGAGLGQRIVDALFTAEFRAAVQSSRHALRLDGDWVAARSATGAISTGVSAGCVQLTGEGLPLVLLAEHQATGGYPIAACVIWADVPRAAQVRPGDVVRFKRVNIGEARAALYDCAAKLESLSVVRRGPDALANLRLARGFFEGAGS